MMKKIIDRFRGAGGTEIQNYDLGYHSGYIRLPILQNMVGKKVDSTLVSLCIALGAKAIRVSSGETTTDCWNKRVTVIVDCEDIVQSIEIETYFRNTVDKPHIECGRDIINEIENL